MADGAPGLFPHRLNFFGDLEHAGSAKLMKYMRPEKTQSHDEAILECVGIERRFGGVVAISCNAATVSDGERKCMLVLVTPNRVSPVELSSTAR